MAGHSKWSNIKHRKGAQDAKKAKIFTKIGKQLTVAAKKGDNPDFNPSLRTALSAAKKANMPNDNIQKAINKAQEKNADTEVKYTGIGPENISFLVEAITDNSNRTFTEVKTVFNKKGKGIQDLNYMFDHVMHFVIPNRTQDAVLESVLEVEITDIYSEEQDVHLIAPFQNGSQIINIIDKQFPGYTFNPEYIATQTKQIEDIAKLESFIEDLEDLDDVQHVWHNAEYPEN